MASTVTFQGVRLSTADLSTSGGTWDKYGSTQTPSLEEDIIFQGPTEQSNKVSNTTGGLQFAPTSSVDFATTPKTLIAKIQVTTIKALDTSVARGMSYEIGDDDTDNYQYYLVGSGAGDDYPVNAGWWTVIIDPNVAAYRDATPGAAPTLTAVAWVGVYLDITVTVKAENIIHSGLDYVDNGEGLLMTGTDAEIIDFVIEDEDVNATAGEYDNRWRLASRSNGSNTVFDAVAWWTLGSSGTAITIVDENKVIKWTAGRVDTSFHGFRLNLENASTDIALDSFTLISDGAEATNDTRADFECVGTSGVGTVDGFSFLNFNNVTFTSVVSQNGGRIEAKLLTQNSADISNVIIATSSATSIATLQDPTFGTTTDLHDVTFVQAGAGHGLEIDTAGDYTLTNIFGLNVAAGYGADTTDSAGIDVTASSGTVNLTISGGDTPTYKTAGATVNIIAGAVLVQAAAALKDGTPVENARVLLKASDGTGPFPFEDTVTITRSTTTATVAHTAHGMATNDKIYLEGITDKTEDNWRVIQITVTGVNAYTFTTTDSGSTSYTGTIKSTFVALNGLTNASGILSTSRVYASNQPVTGWTRKSTSTPFLQEGVLVGTVNSSTGFAGTAVMLADE